MASDKLWCRMTVFGPDDAPLGRWTLAGSGPPRLCVVQLIARTYLAARWLGGTAAITDATPALTDLFELAGLGELLGQMRREAEGREEPLGIEERVVRGDPPG